MDDLISRQKTINTWKEDFKKFVNGLDDIPWDDYIVIMQYIDNMPPAQSKVVRCKDCKHRPTATEADKNIYTGFSVEFPDGICPCQCEDGWYNWYPEDDFYCGKAERRGEL